MTEKQSASKEIKASSAEVETVDAQSALVFRSFQEACDWSKENAGKAFVHCDDGTGYRPVTEAEAFRAGQSWHDHEELYIDDSHPNEMS